MKELKFDWGSAQNHDPANIVQGPVARVEMAVEGFWSKPISVTISRSNFNRAAESVWTPRISWSSGGHDNDHDDLVRCRNFAKALEHATAVYEYTLNNQELFEVAFQSYMKSLDNERERQQQLREEALAKDPAYGKQAAKIKVNKAVADLKASDGLVSGVVIAVKERASCNYMYFVIRKRIGPDKRIETMSFRLDGEGNACHFRCDSRRRATEVLGKGSYEGSHVFPYAGEEQRERVFNGLPA